MVGTLTVPSDLPRDSMISSLLCGQVSLPEPCIGRVHDTIKLGFCYALCRAPCVVRGRSWGEGRDTDIHGTIVSLASAPLPVSYR